MISKNNKKKYYVAGPYFNNKDISWILKKTKGVLKGKLSTGPYTSKFEKVFASFRVIRQYS